MFSVLLLSAGHDELIGPLVVASLVAARRLAPRSNWMTSAAGFAFTTAVRVIDRVHSHATVYRTASEPAGATRLADGNIFVVQVAHLSDRRHAIDQHAAGFARRQFEQRVIAFFRDQLRLRSRRTRHLCALAWFQLDVVHRGPRGNVAQR